VCPTAFQAALVIISSVKRFFILLLIVLLPLRGWGAQLMSTQMAAGQAAVHVGESSGAQAAMAADCPMMAAMQGTAHDTPNPDSDVQRNCQSCQLCMPLIALPPLTIDNFEVKPQAPQVSHLSRFVSAELERAVKPPIS
jgi:hypothetical protein